MKFSSETCVRVWLAVLLAVLVVGSPFAAPAPSLPDGWSTRDVGIVGTRGVALGRGGAFILRGAGSAIGDLADSFQFAYTALNGDGEIVARVTEITTNEDGATAGVMLRESFAVNARFAYMRVGAKHGLAFERRGPGTAQTSSSTTAQAKTTQTATTQTTPTRSSVAKARSVTSTTPPPSRRAPTTAVIGGLAVSREPESRSADPENAISTQAGDEAPPAYLRLVRHGDVITAFKSADGNTWTQVGSDTVPMSSTIYAGLVVNNHSLTSLATASFTGVRLTRGTGSSPVPETVTAAATSTPTGSPLPVVTTPAPTPAPPTPTPAPETAAPATSSPPPTPPSPPPASPSGDSPDPGDTLSVMHWNIHHGIGTDGVLDPDRIARWVAAIAPNVVSLNEVDTPELADQLHERIEARTGHTWTAQYAGDTLLVTRLNVQATTVCTTNSSVPSMAAGLVVGARNRQVNLWSVHLSVNSTDTRISELRTLQSCANYWPQVKVIAGDFNMQASSSEYAVASDSYIDAWAAARAAGNTINYPGNCDGCTRNSRIDYVFASANATWLVLQYTQVFDTRDSNGITPSDHKPMLAVYAVQ